MAVVMHEYSVKRMVHSFRLLVSSCQSTGAVREGRKDNTQQQE
jgi:hypothetical protein